MKTKSTTKADGWRRSFEQAQEMAPRQMPATLIHFQCNYCGLGIVRSAKAIVGWPETARFCRDCREIK